MPCTVLAGGDRVIWHPKQATLELVARQNEPAPTAEITLSPWPDGALAHIKLDTRSTGLSRGALPWEGGRVMMIWRAGDGRILPGLHGLSGIEGSRSAVVELVGPMLNDGPPSILIQNLGKTGSLVVANLSIHVLRYRAWLPWVSGALVCAAWLWLHAVLGRIFPGAVGRWRKLTAATILLTAFWFMVFPGPWTAHYPIGDAFDIRATSSPPADFAMVPPPGGGQATTTTANALPPGKMDAGVFWESYMWVKHHARTLLHILAFAGLTAVLKISLGGGMAWLPVAVIAVASESMQYLFGFGADWQDAADLLVDMTGILLGFAVARWALARHRRYRGKTMDAPA